VSIDRERAEIYNILATIFLKLLFGIVAISAFVVVLVIFLRDPSFPLVGMEAVLSGTVYVCFRHLFPSGPGP
jgi:hypothetical protein